MLEKWSIFPITREEPLLEGRKGKWGHGSICRQLGIVCVSNGEKCPPDEFVELHDIYHHRCKYLIPFTGVYEIKPPHDEDDPRPDEDQCERFLIDHLERLKTRLHEKQLEVDFSDPAIRLCWTAHIVVDHASDFYWEARGKYLATQFTGREKKHAFECLARKTYSIYHSY